MRVGASKLLFSLSNRARAVRATVCSSPGFSSGEFERVDIRVGRLSLRVIHCLSRAAFTQFVSRASRANIRAIRLAANSEIFKSTSEDSRKLSMF